MYTRIKELADSAVALQNKANMEAALREISALCGGIKVVSGLAETDASCVGEMVDRLKDLGVDLTTDLDKPENPKAVTSAFEDAKALTPLEVVLASKAKKAAKK